MDAKQRGGFVGGWQRLADQVQPWRWVLLTAGAVLVVGLYGWPWARPAAVFLWVLSMLAANLGEVVQLAQRLGEGWPR